MTSVVLGVLALLLSGPLPAVVARTPRLRVVPRAAMVLWQSIALAALLAALGATLSIATGSLLSADRSPWRYGAAGFALAVTLVVVARLLLTAHLVGSRLRVIRRKHRTMVDLLGAADAGVNVLHHETPMAYCLPGLRSRVVVSDATLAVLASDEVAAVLAHERAHLRARHDLVLEAFTVLHTAFPRWVSSRMALDEVALLVEVLADRAAVRRLGARPLARALVAMAGSTSPRASLGAVDTGVVARIRLLSDQAPHRALGVVVSATALAVLALPTFFVVLPWLTGLA